MSMAVILSRTTHLPAPALHLDPAMLTLDEDEPVEDDTANLATA